MGQCAHLRNYASIDGCQVIAIAEPRTKLAAAVATRYGVPAVYPDAESMLHSEKLDGIVAIQRFEHHGSVVMPLYGYGLPILTEKPLASSVEQREKMVAAIRAAVSWHMVAYHKRCDPATLAAKAEIDRLKRSGELGKLTYVRITMPEGDWVANGFIDMITTDEPAPKTAQDPRPSGMDEATFHRYVTFVNYYIHQVNLLRHLLGEPIRAVYADRSGLLLVAESASGITGTIEMSPYKTRIEWQESALVTFERGYVKLDLPAPLALNRPGSVEFYRDGESVRPTLPWVHAMRNQAEAFVQAIQGKGKPPCEAEEALEDLTVAKQYIEMVKR
jgi:predicted dehydrogenase